MMGNSRLTIILLCAVLMTVCMTGCGAGEDTGTGESAIADGAGEDPVTDGSAAVRSDEETAVKESVSFEGLGLSILGDSISAFDGYIPSGFSVYYPFDGEVTDVSQTWWMQLLDETGMELCANDSSAGSTCAGDSLSVDEPLYGCGGYRISLLAGKQGRMPDVIIVYMGANDVMNGVPIGDNDGTKLVEEGIIENFSDAYCLMLDKLASEYPVAQIYCCTLLPMGDWGTATPFVTFTNGLGLTSEDYSRQIQVIAKNKGLPVIDLYHCGVEIDNMQIMTTDGVHPTPEGMKCVKQAVLSGMREAPPL